MLTFEALLHLSRKTIVESGRKKVSYFKISTPFMLLMIRQLNNWGHGWSQDSSQSLFSEMKTDAGQLTQRFQGSNQGPNGGSGRQGAGIEAKIQVGYQFKSVFSAED